MKKLSLIIAAVFVFGVANAVVGPTGDDNTAAHTVGIDIENLAIIDIESAGNGGSDITLSPSAPTEAGEAVTFSEASNSDLWLNYSSIVSNGKQRSISASISDGLPVGLSLKVAASDVVEQYGKGRKGSANKTPKKLTHGGIDVVTGIGSCYTGDGANKGTNLTYTLDMEEDKYEQLYQDSYSVTVTYTITE